MVQLKHFDHDGRARFVTFCTHRKLPILTNDTFRMIVVEALDEVRKQSEFRLLAWVIMPEHVHLVIVPSVESKLGPIIGEIKRISARRIHKLLTAGESDLLSKLIVVRRGTRKFALWLQRCYDHNCRTDNEIREKIMYCHNNPVRRGLVGSPDNWRWSSHSAYSGQGTSKLKVDASELI